MSEESLEMVNLVFFCFALSAQCLFLCVSRIVLFLLRFSAKLVEKPSRPGARTSSHGIPIGICCFAHRFNLFALPGSVEPFDLMFQIFKSIKKLT